MYLIIGLGNPGKEYEYTRHNIGFRAIDRLSKNLEISVTKDQCQALIGQGKVNDHKIILAKPQTFMNKSGGSVRELANWYKIEPDKIIVIHDDLDLDIGRLKMIKKGNSAGHKGVESIAENLGTTEFIRIRIGIGRETLGGDNSEYVLDKIPAREMDDIDGAILTAAEAVVFIISNGVEAAMNIYNQS